MSRESEQSITPTDVVFETIETSLGAAILAATGHPVAIGIAAVGEAVLIKRAIKRIREIKSSEVSSPKSKV
ncbi:MAG TPA: hypothetical protein VKC54_04130 [Patescibacteria group bacterium]|nr:hypothetical protein [Patescibacteria group bacterium]